MSRPLGLLIQEDTATIKECLECIFDSFHLLHFVQTSSAVLRTQQEVPQLFCSASRRTNVSCGLIQKVMGLGADHSPLWVPKEHFFTLPHL